MRLIGFIGILALLAIAFFSLFFAVQAGDWKGIVLMLFFIALLVFFAVTLWRGRQSERTVGQSGRLVEGWFGESVTSFFLNQVLKSPEGIILLVGSALSLAMAVAAALSPSTVGLASSRGSGNAVLFGMWPMLAFVLYVKICGPRFVTGVFSVACMLAVALFPFVIAYK